MGDSYRYNHTLNKHRLRHVLAVSLISIIIIAIVAGIVGWKLHQDHKKSVFVQGTGLSVAQPGSAQSVENIDEPTYTMQLPSDWKQISSSDTAKLHDTEWQATIKNGDNRWLTVYVDTIPSSYAVNRELPLTVNGDRLAYGSLSDNCANFTPGGTTNAAQAETLKPAPSVWQGVNFICNLPQVVDNQTGTGTAGSSANITTITGPTSGTHSYFFLYIDRNAQPDYSIFYNAIESFRAK